MGGWKAETSASLRRFTVEALYKRERERERTGCDDGTDIRVVETMKHA